MEIDFNQYNAGSKLSSIFIILNNIFIGTRRKFSDIDDKYPTCNFSSHAYCASPLMRNFTYEDCGCDPGCLSVHFTVENIIYGAWRTPLMFAPNVSVGSFMITVPEGSEVDYEEEPAYTLESLFSDVGGAAGLGLGMSLATFFGALEYFIYRILNLVMKFVKMKIRFLADLLRLHSKVEILYLFHL